MARQKTLAWLRIANTKAGRIALVASEQGLLLTTLPGRATKDARRKTPATLAGLGPSTAAPPEAVAALLERAGRALCAYYAQWPRYPGPDRLAEAWRDLVALPLDLEGLTSFTRAVLGELRTVQPGTVVSYADLASRAGSPKAARAVGSVMARNPLPIVLPCHRVVASDGGLGGFAGETRGEALALKARLLRYEGWLPPG